MNWKKISFGLFLVAMVLSLQLIATPQAMAMSVNNSSITFRRAVVAWYDDTGKLQMNVTWVNKVVNLTNLTKGCPLHNSNVTPKVNVSVVTLYNMTEKREQLLFFRLNFYNETFNYTMYALVYRAERSQYNFTLVTRIFTDPKTGEYKAYLTGMNIAPANEKRVVPVGDIILTANNLTLSEYYWTLNKVLMKLRRHDETAWVWGRSAFELRHLSHLVKLKLPEYNQQKAVGMAITMDGWGCWLCSISVGTLCAVAYHYLVCVATCTALSEGWGAAVCAVICSTLGEILSSGVSCGTASYIVCEKIGAC